MAAHFILSAIIISLADISSGSSISVPPLTSSLPTANEYDCCFFYDDPCGSSGDWFWSKEIPSIYTNCEFPYCVWTNRSGAEWVSPLQYNVTSGTTFTFQYSFSTSDVQIQLGFKDSTSGLTFDLGVVSRDDGYWPGFSFNCTSCCGTNTLCDGYIIMTAMMSGSYGEVGMDNFGRDTLCYGTLECCTFDDPSLCGSVSEVQDGYQWIFSGDKYPTYPLPSPGSNFVYFEAVNSTSGLSISLKTELIYLIDESIFSFNCYVYNTEYLVNTLYVYFTDIETGSRAEVYRTTMTSSTWTYRGAELSFACVGSFYECNGYLEFEANVNANGSHVLFAIDSLDINYGCISPY